MIRATAPAGYVGCCHAIPKINVTARLREIPCPIQVIVGEQDAATPPADSKRMAEKIKGAKLEIIPNAGHLSNIEQPDVFNKAVRKFLESLPD